MAAKLMTARKFSVSLPQRVAIRMQSTEPGQQFTGEQTVMTSTTIERALNEQAFGNGDNMSFGLQSTARCPILLRTLPTSIS